MKKFEAPELEVIQIAVEDVITTSIDEGRDDELPIG
jgi:hypothetical protein